MPQTLDLTVPTSWEELTDQQLQYVIRLLAAGIPQPRIEIYCLLRWNNLRPVDTPVPLPEGVRVLRQKDVPYHVSTDDLAVCAAAMEWMRTPPSVPVRPSQLGKRKALDAQLHGVPFSIYLQTENLYQAFLQTKNPDALLRLWNLLYPGKRPPGKELAEMLPPLFLLWLSGLKQLFSATFPHLFRPASKSSGGEEPDMAAIMNAEIRALTGGDITKTKEVLEADTWNALHELDAKAREAEEMERIRSSH